ncbi:MAG: hypothetical protein ACRELY_18385 [Polyangiaceae bacterium]
MKTWKNIGILAVSALSLGVVACGGSDGAPGAKGDTGAAGATGPAGDATPKSVGVIVPNIGLLDRDLDVTVTTNGVDLTKAAPAVDMGAGVTVSNIQVLSSTTLYAHLKVDAAAATGARDVKVTEGSDSLTSTKGFTVATPMSVTVTPSPAQQGGLILVDATNLDQAHAFDTSGNFSLQLSEGFLFQAFASTTATEATGAVAFLAPNAGATSDAVGVNFDSLGDPVETYAGDSFPISSRTQATVTVGTPLTGENIAAIGASNVYKMSTSTASIMEVTVTPTGANLQLAPVVAIYNGAGKRDDFMQLFGSATPGNTGTYAFPTTANAATNVLSVFDAATGGGAAADYGFTISAVARTGTAFAEPGTAHGTYTDAATNAVVPALPAAGTNNGDIVTGTLAAGDNDWYAVALADNDVLEITMVADFAGVLDIADTSGNSIGIDPFFGTDFRCITGPGSRGPTTVISGPDAFDPFTAGTYYIHISGATASDHGSYNVSLRKR